MKNRLPLVAIIGLPNVGKSALFNRLVGAPKAIVAREPGTTRSQIAEIVNWRKKTWQLVDTAGAIERPRQADDPELAAAIKAQLAEAEATADAIVLVVDGSRLVTEAERRLAKTALKSGRPVVLVVNKIDKAGPTQPSLGWGIKSIVHTSATQKRGITELLEVIANQLPRTGAVKPAAKQVLAIVGRPNVGKSLLFNQLASRPRALVSAKAGTTRDLNQAVVKVGNRQLQIIDTGGIRRPGRRRDIEAFSYLRTLKAVADADVAVLVTDATEPSTTLDQNIAGMVSQAGQGLILTVNKWDLIEDKSTSRLAIEQQLTNDFGHVWWAPVVFMSAKTGRQVERIGELALRILKRRAATVTTSQLNQVLIRAVSQHPPAGLKRRQPKLKYITQTGTQPPEFTLFGSQLEFLHWSYKRYLEAQLRQAFDFTGTPIKLVFRPKTKLLK